jgi:hypothetical protein
VDISNAKSVAEQEEEGTVVHVKDASGELAYNGDKPVTITVMGTYSTTYRKAVSSNRDKWLKRRQTLDGDSLDKQAIETTAACVKSWDGFTSGTDPYPATKANVIALLENAPWIREQVETAMGDHQLFTPKPLAA